MMQNMSGEKLKGVINLELSVPCEGQEQNLPSDYILAFPVQSCNRFKCLASKLVGRQKALSGFQPPTLNEECPPSRVQFYSTLCQHIKLSNEQNKQGEISCKSNDENQREISCKSNIIMQENHDCLRQLSKEDYLWQSELKEVIWLELKAWQSGRTIKEQDDFLVEARKNVEKILLDIMNYRFLNQSDQMSTESNDSGIEMTADFISSAEDEMTTEEDKCSKNPDYSCLSLFCHFCLERQNCAFRDIECLLDRLEEAEQLFPSYKSLGEQYPLYNSSQFKARIKAMQLWENMFRRHRLKLISIGRRILFYVELKKQNFRYSSSSNTSVSSDSNHENTHQGITMADIPLCTLTTDICNIQPLLKVGKYFQHLRNDERHVYRQYIEDLLKTKGIRKALDFLEKLQIYVLHKGAITLQKPSFEEESRYKQINTKLDLSEDEELERYGYWCPETRALRLPSYRASYLFLARIPLDIIHEFLRMRLEIKPKHPSNLSIIQLIRELKDGLSLAVLSRQRYLLHMKTALWDAEPSVFEEYKSSISEFEANTQRTLEVYLDYLQQWVQMNHQERVQKNILKEEWIFINTITPHIPGGQALLAQSFCEMTSLLLRFSVKQFKKSFTKCTENIGTPIDSSTKSEKLAICRELQSLCTETRLKTLSIIALAKNLRKDLEKEECKEDPKCSAATDSLNQLKIEAILMCDCLLHTVVRLDQITDALKSWEGRLREVVHQFFKFGFEYHKEVCWVVTGSLRPELSRCLLTFAQQWMVFAKQRCERGRGLRPRWANQGFDFLTTICEPHFTTSLTDEEFEELKKNIDECIVHVIGTSVPNSSDATNSPCSLKSREYISPGFYRNKPFRRNSSNNSEIDSSPSPEVEMPDLRNLSRSEKIFRAIYKLDQSLESRLKANDLIGEVLSVNLNNSERNYIMPRPVKFHWQRGIKIGQGRFGKVYTAVNNETGELMAMKEIPLQPNDHHTIRSVALELKIFEGIQHENLVRYYGVEIHREEMLIFMELCTEGMLESLISATEAGLPEGLVRRYTLQLVTAVNTLHRNSIVHRDIKSANIFLTDGGNCLKIGDFGSAVKIRAHTTMAGELQGFVGTQAYMAPEVFMKNTQEGHGRAIDVWSLGCVLIEMASGKRPWANFDSNYQIMFKVGMGEAPDIPESLSEEGQHFVSLCLVHDPKERATTAELLNHIFLAVNNEKESLTCSIPSILENFLKLGVKS